MKVIEEKVVRKGTTVKGVPVEENVATPFITMLCKYFAQYYAKKIQEDSGDDKDYVMEQLAKGRPDEEMIQLIGDYVFDLGGLSERLDLYLLDSLNIMFMYIGMNKPIIDDREISKYIYQILKKSKK